MSELKPCPFCGSKRVDTLKGNWMESDKPFWKVWCKSCQLRTWCEPSRKAAIAVWNARTADDELAAAKARIAELERALERIKHRADAYADAGELEPVAWMRSTPETMWGRSLFSSTEQKGWAPLYTHPAQPRNEVQAEALEELAEEAEEAAEAARQIEDWAAYRRVCQVGSEARKKAARLRSNGGDD